MTESHPICLMSIGPPIPEVTAISKFDLKNPWSRPSVWSHCWLSNQSIYFLFVSYHLVQLFLRYSYLNIWPWNLKVKPNGHIWGPEFNRYGCFSFIGNHFFKISRHLKIQGQGHGQGQNRWSHLWPRFQSICLLIVSWQLDHFWLRNIKFHIWLLKFKVKVQTKIDQIRIRQYIWLGH